MISNSFIVMQDKHGILNPLYKLGSEYLTIFYETDNIEYTIKTFLVPVSPLDLETIFMAKRLLNPEWEFDLVEVTPNEKDDEKTKVEQQVVVFQKGKDGGLFWRIEEYRDYEKYWRKIKS